jgi:hypothetical protein
VSSKKARGLAEKRRGKLWGMMANDPYNSLLKFRFAVFKPVVAMSFYTVSCGEKRVVEPSGPEEAVVFKDDSFLTIYEKWSVPDNRLTEYTLRYQVPRGISIRYEMDSDADSASHPEYHLHVSALGDDYRLPTGKVKSEEVLRMIFEQFVGPKYAGP